MKKRSTFVILFLIIFLSISVASASTIKTYIYAGSLVASKDNAEDTQYYIQDHLGSNVQVTENGITEQANKYYAFGIIESVGGDNDYKYTGKPFDDETGLYYYGARYYSPELGRFLSSDALRGNIEDPLSLNRYAYVKNNPLKYVDPTGNGPMVFYYNGKILPPDSLIWFGKIQEDFGKKIELLGKRQDLPIISKIGQVVSAFAETNRDALEGAVLGMVSIPGGTSGGKKVIKTAKEAVDEIFDIFSSGGGKKLGEIVVPNKKVAKESLEKLGVKVVGNNDIYGIPVNRVDKLKSGEALDHTYIKLKYDKNTGKPFLSNPHHNPASAHGQVPHYNYKLPGSNRKGVIYIENQI